VQMLLDKGADVNADALEAASGGGHNEVVRLLLDINAQGGEHRNALQATS